MEAQTKKEFWRKMQGLKEEHKVMVEYFLKMGKEAYEGEHFGNKGLKMDIEHIYKAFKGIELDLEKLYKEFYKRDLKREAE